MNRIAAFIINFGLLVLASACPLLGGHVVADVVVYKAFLTSFIKEVFALPARFSLVFENTVFHLSPLFDRAQLLQMNDPLLI
jgi:hypothetical protein